MSTVVDRISVMTVGALLLEPIRLGAWAMQHREFAFVRVTAGDHAD
jgi:hypothetical protein